MGRSYLRIPESEKNAVMRKEGGQEPAKRGGEEKTPEEKWVGLERDGISAGLEAG